MHHQLLEHQKAFGGKLISLYHRTRITRPSRRPNHIKPHHLDQEPGYFPRSAQPLTVSGSAKRRSVSDNSVSVKQRPTSDIPVSAKQTSAIASKTQNVQRSGSSIPHAFERWETLSSHWEGLTSYWIRRLEENSNQLGEKPLHRADETPDHRSICSWR
jgi:hypothetical protein